MKAPRSADPTRSVVGWSAHVTQFPEGGFIRVKPLACSLESFIAVHANRDVTFEDVDPLIISVVLHDRSSGSLNRKIKIEKFLFDQFSEIIT